MPDQDKQTGLFRKALAFFSSLRVLLFITTLIAIIPLAFLIIYNDLNQVNKEISHIEDRALQRAELSRTLLESTLQDARHALINFTSLERSQIQNPTECNERARFIFGNSMNLSNLLVLTPDGHLYCSALPMRAQTDFSTQLWYQRFFNSGTYDLQESSLGRVDNEQVILISYPLFDENKQISLIGVAVIKQDWLLVSFNKLELSKGSTISIIDRKGAILFRYPKPGAAYSRIPAEQLDIMASDLRRMGTYDGTGIDGEAMLFGFTTVNLTPEGEFLQIGLPSDQAYAEVNSLLIRNGIIICAALVLVLLAVRSYGTSIIWSMPRGTWRAEIYRFGHRRM